MVVTWDEWGGDGLDEEIVCCAQLNMRAKKMGKTEIFRALTEKSTDQIVRIPVLDILKDHPWRLPGACDINSGVSHN